MSVKIYLVLRTDGYDGQERGGVYIDEKQAIRRLRALAHDRREPAEDSGEWWPRDGFGSPRTWREDGMVEVWEGKTRSSTIWTIARGWHDPTLDPPLRTIGGGGFGLVSIGVLYGNATTYSAPLPLPGSEGDDQ